MHLILAYLQFLLKSTNHHGVHSPFLFHWITQCLYDKKPHSEYDVLENFRQSLLQSKQVIEVTDFGAGSRVFKSNQRAVSQIAKTAGISPKRAKALVRISQYFQPETILEIGTSLGIGSAALALGNPNSKVITLEGCPETAKVAKQNFELHQIQNIQSKVGEFDNLLPEIIQQNPKIDLIYFDGNHTKEATISYFQTLLKTAHNDSIWIFDDIHWSEEMEAAWEIIKSHPQTTATVDTFQWGFVFFRKEQLKEHFSIRM